MSIEPIKNQRDFTRVNLSVEADFEATSGEPRELTPCIVQDLSLKGAFISGDSSLSAKSRCRLTLWLGGREAGTAVHVEAKVIRSLSDGMALEFVQICGPESFSHLRNLVLYNASDAGEADHIEREFKGHLGIKQRTGTDD